MDYELGNILISENPVFSGQYEFLEASEVTYNNLSFDFAVGILAGSHDEHYFKVDITSFNEYNDIIYRYISCFVDENDVDSIYHLDEDLQAHINKWDGIRSSYYFPITKKYSCYYGKIIYQFNSIDFVAGILNSILIRRFSWDDKLKHIQKIIVFEDDHPQHIRFEHRSEVNIVDLIREINIALKYIILEDLIKIVRSYVSDTDTPEMLYIVDIRPVESNEYPTPRYMELVS